MADEKCRLCGRRVGIGADGNVCVACERHMAREAARHADATLSTLPMPAPGDFVDDTLTRLPLQLRARVRVVRSGGDRVGDPLRVTFHAFGDGWRIPSGEIVPPLSVALCFDPIDFDRMSDAVEPIAADLVRRMTDHLRAVGPAALAAFGLTPPAR